MTINRFETPGGQPALGVRWPGWAATCNGTTYQMKVVNRPWEYGGWMGLVGGGRRYGIQRIEGDGLGQGCRTIKAQVTLVGFWGGL